MKAGSPWSSVWRVAVLVLGACGPGLAWAAEEPAGAGPDQPHDADLAKEVKWIRAEAVTVSTASLRDETIAHAPATIRVITRKQIQERGYRSLYELLRDQPGVDVLDHVQAEAKLRITFRGISGNHKFLILQDGVRINSPTGENIQPIAENYPLYNVKQVEILYGPASAVYGADAMTAVINLVTLPPTPEGRAVTSVEMGEFGTFRSDVYAAQRFSDAVALSLGGHYQRTDAPDLADAYPGQYPFDDLRTFDGVTVIPLAERNDYSGAFYSYSTWAKLELGPNLVLGWNHSLLNTRYSEGTLASFTDYDDEGGTRLMTGYGKYTFESGDRVTGSVELDYSRYEQLPDSHFQNQVINFQNGYLYALGERYQMESQASYALEDHIFTAGLTLQYIHAIPHTSDLEFKYDRDRGPGEQNQFHLGTDHTLPLQIFELDYVNVGCFLQEQAQWSDAFSTTLGLRFDHNEDYGDTWNPRLGLVYELSERTTWKALYGQAYLAPSPFERFENFGGFAFRQPDGVYHSFFFHVPNEDLDPEELQSFELSVSHQPWAGLQIGVAGYYNTVDDVILTTRTPEPVTDFVPGGFIEYTEAAQNVGEIDSYGGELTVDQSFTWAGTKCDLWASYSHIEGELRNNLTGLDTDLPFTSTDLLKLGLTCNYANRFILTPSVRWNGPQSGLTAMPETVIETDSFAVADLYAEVCNARQTVAFFLRVTNLFDARYYHAQRELTGLIFAESPQDPRWITGGVRISI